MKHQWQYLERPKSTESGMEMQGWHPVGSAFNCWGSHRGFRGVHHLRPLFIVLLAQVIEGPEKARRRHFEQINEDAPSECVVIDS
jgi:hypothetical protein